MSDLERAQEWLRCRRGEFVNTLTGENEAICEIHGLADDWPCNKATSLAALLAEVAAEGAADGIEGLMHELADADDAELAARRADQWRAQARATGADQ